ncbi:ABC transporter substrate-binding protein [Microbacterium sp. bgisy189]|uniref:ABC transporter substrate-binding protein n=1 Tax=Microbacterium sp. bgisy189 TaxID=3413798 RepID=UPI003EB9AD05
MNTRALRRTGLAVGAVTVSALALSACGGGDTAATPDADPDEPIELTLATFNDFGYTDELLQQYMDDHPNVTIVHNRAAESGDARANYFQKLGKGGLADVEAVEIDWFAEAMQYSDLLAEAPDSVKGRWLDWKEAAATDADGRLVGFGTDIGPQAVCYRSDLFAEAGLPSDRAEVAALFDGDWDNFLDVADQYREATGQPMIDSANSVLQGIVNQMEYTYTEADGTVIATTNPEIQAAYELVVERAIPNSAYSGQWSDDWFASMAGGEFAAMLCPGWMLGVIEGGAPEVAGWDIADVFPGGGGNWGGSYLTVPADGDNVEAALALADWLTAPEQQMQAFESAGTFPSQTEALEGDELAAATNAYFNDAPTGEILSSRADAVTVAPYKDENYFTYHDGLQNAVNRVFDGLEDAETSWNTWVAEVEAL